MNMSTVSFVREKLIKCKLPVGYLKSDFFLEELRLERISVA